MLGLLPVCIAEMLIISRLYEWVQCITANDTGLQFTILAVYAAGLLISHYWHEMHLYNNDVLLMSQWHTVVMMMMISRGHSNLTKRPHRRGTWTVQSYLPGGANVPPHLMRAFLEPPKFTLSCISISSPVFCTADGRVLLGRHFPPQNCPFACRDLLPI